MSFILKSIRSFIRLWHNHVSFLSYPLFKIGEHYEQRDFGLCVLFALSVGAFCGFPASSSEIASSVIIGYVCFRLVDAITALFSIAVFGGIHTPRIIVTLPEERIWRLMVLLPLNYVELLFLFATCYLWIARYLSGSFNDAINTRADSFFLSMTTMTTIGYGRIAPVGSVALGIATFQALIGILVIVNVLAVYVAYATRSMPPSRNDSGVAADDKMGCSHSKPALLWALPVVVLGVLSATLYLVQRLAESVD